jgi:hypothetical protein
MATSFIQVRRRCSTSVAKASSCAARARESKEDRRPHLLAEEAYTLLSDSLTVFRQQHGHFPARVVLHKTSLFSTDERDGFNRALGERGIDYADLIFVSKTFTRLYRIGAYPQLRGTLMRLDDRQVVLYTRGSVESLPGQIAEDCDRLFHCP